MTTVSELNVGDIVRLEGGSWDSPRAGREGDVTGITTGRERECDKAYVNILGASYVDDEEWPFVLVRRAEPDYTELLAFVRERIGHEGTADFRSFSDLTDHALATLASTGLSPSAWAAHRGIRPHLESGAIQRWAEERGFGAPEFTPPTLEELQVGDRVRLVGGHWAGHRREGQVLTVDRTFAENGYSVRLDTGNILNSDFPFEFVERPGVTEPEPEPEPEPEKTLEEALAAGEYHPALLPFMERISKVACDEGWCPEYDRLARKAGAPTRAEVTALVAERDGGKYRVRYTFPIHIDIDVEAVSEDEAREKGFSETNMWSQILTHVEARIADLRARGVEYQFGNWNTDPASITVIED